MRRAIVLCLLNLLALAALGQDPVAARLLTPADVVVLAFADARTLPPEVQPYTRYLWLPNLPVADRPLSSQIFAAHVNQLSRRRGLEPSRVVPGTDGQILAVNLVDYGWDVAVWDQFGEGADPTFVTVVVTKTVEKYEVQEHWEGGTVNGKVYPPGTYRVPKEKVTEKKTRTFAPWLVRGPADRVAVEGLAALTQAQVPIVNGLVFLDNTGASGDGRKPDYYDIQGIKDQATFEKLVGVEIAADVAFAGDVLAAVGISGVTQEARAIQRLEKIAGALYRSLDVNKGTATGKKNAMRILGTDGKGNPILQFDASEIYAHGANGLWKFGLFNAAGVKQARAPDTIAQQAAPAFRNSHSVLNGVSCIGCHTNGGLQDIRDFVRSFPPELNIFTFQGGTKKPLKYEDVRQLKEQYTTRLEPLLAQDRLRYASALLTISGLKPEQFALEFVRAWRYAADPLVDAEWASRELGVPPDLLRRAIQHQIALRTADPVLAALTIPVARRQPIPLTAWREVVPLAHQYLAALPR